MGWGTWGGEGYFQIGELIKKKNATAYNVFDILKKK